MILVDSLAHAATQPPVAVALDLTIFIACYNEAANIVATIETVAATLADWGRPHEIIVIDDASTDGSAGLVQRYQQAHPEVPLRLIVNPSNRGLARNFVQAALGGRGTYFKLVCGDNVETRETLVRILSEMGHAELILSYHERCLGRTPFRLWLSRTYTRLVNGLNGHSIRYYNGLPLFRRADVLRHSSATVGFGFQAELVTNLLDQGVTYREVCVEAQDRTHGTSSALTWRNFRAVAATLGRIGLRRLRRAVNRLGRMA